MQACCPFSGSECDGGGNRYSSALHMREHRELARCFPGKTRVQAGVCSLMVGGTPWVVCPRRLLTMHGAGTPLQSSVVDGLVRYGGLSKCTEYRTWSEVKISVHDREAKRTKSFDYTFDYIVAGRCRKSIPEISSLVGMTERMCIRLAEDNRFTLARRDGTLWVEDYPSLPLLIVEVMSSSTSGGNKAKRTRIGMAFKDALLRGADHQGPGINYRQVWARMVSQLLVKSQVGVEWGGKTIWIMQDVLADYISSTTALDIGDYEADRADEVNVITVGYGDASLAEEGSGILPLGHLRFFSGPIAAATRGTKPGGFVDIVKAGFVPPVELLWKALFRKKSCGVLPPRDP